MSSGTGYRYLLQSVVAGDGHRPASTPLTRYYTEPGTPPGRWLGAGLPGLGHDAHLQTGSVVTEEQLFRLLGMAQHPLTQAPLGAAPHRAGGSGTGTSGRAVAGFDLTMSVPKSVSIVWAVADARTQELIVAAHHSAIADTLAWAERNVFATRTGRGGAAQVGVRGVIAACFDHYDSRANDPHLHTHVVVANRVQSGGDDKWRTLDSRALFRATVAMSELHQGLLMDRLAAALGVGWDGRARRRSAVPQWEITGVPDQLRREFSQRSASIETDKDRLVEDYIAAHGRAPSVAAVLKLRQRATLQTRPDKQLLPLAELTHQWRNRARRHIGDDTVGWATSLSHRARSSSVSTGADDGRLHRAAESVLAAVAEKRATFTRWNVLAESHRQLHGLRLGDPAARIALADRIVDLALSRAMLLTAPDELRPEHVTTQAVPGWAHTSRYTTSVLFDAEERLLTAARRLDAPTAPGPTVVPAADPERSPVRARLSGEQRAAVAQISTSGRRLDVLVGAAGTGKTATMAGLAATWRASFGPGSVVALAPSAAAAEVLAGELQLPTENTAMWLTQTALEPQRRERLARLAGTQARLPRHSPATKRVRDVARALLQDINRWRLRPGQLVIIDEASLAGTVTLDRIVTQAGAVNAKVLLVGDYAQLAAVDAGGAFGMLAHDRPDVAELLDVHRFANHWEKTASLQLRAGDPDVIDTLAAHGRLHGGDRDAMLDAAYAAWLADTSEGRPSLLLAADTATVTDLNHRARTDLVASGHVASDGIELADGTIAGVGDLIVARQNDRHTSTGNSTSWIKNGDEFTVLAQHPDGSLTVKRNGQTGTANLTSNYVCQHVDLAYATTAHRAEGRTVDTAHAVITGPATTREALYVLVTRGRAANHVYLAADATAEFESADSHRDPHELLAAILRNVGAEQTAHEVLSQAWSPLHGELPEHGGSQERPQFWQDHLTVQRIDDGRGL